MTCKTCGGQKQIRVGNQVVACPVCGGTGKEPEQGLPFAYEGNITLVANAAGLLTINITDHAFRWDLAAAVSTGVFTSRVMDGKNKRPFSNQQIHNQNFWGTAQNPFPLLTPYVFPKRGSILIEVTDISGAGNTIRVTLHGIELED